MSHLLRGLWWLPTLALLPVLLPQALHTRRHALRLEPAAGEQQGEVPGSHDQAPLRLLVIGESTVAGVGVEQQADGLVAQLAQALAADGRAVQWRAVGENGITARQAAERLLPLSLQAPADLVLLVFGVNDTTHFSSRRAWLDGLRAMVMAWQARGAQVTLSAVPPLARFHALPWLLRQVLGWRGRLLDRELRELAASLGVRHCAPTLAFEPAYLARDGYHPSALGYRVWASGLAGLLRAERSAAIEPAC